MNASLGECHPACVDLKHSCSALSLARDATYVYAAIVMRDAGLALNATFKGQPVAGWPEGAGTVNTTVGVPIVIELPGGGSAPFDYVVSMEDLRYGQRIVNYSFEFQARGRSIGQL